MNATKKPSSPIVFRRVSITTPSSWIPVTPKPQVLSWGAPYMEENIKEQFRSAIAQSVVVDKQEK